MSRPSLIKWAAAGLAAGLLAPAGPARAIGAPDRATATSAVNAQPVKAATATCPDGTVRYAGGGAVNYGPAGGGGVALTGIVPDVDGESVTVTAAASPGHRGTWSVTAFAICTGSVQPWRITESGTGTATAACPGETRLFGLGFQISGAPWAGQVREIALDPDLTRVRVTAGGPATVTAIALCRPPAADMRRPRAATDTAGWPKTVTRQDDDPDLSVYATGATVTGPEAATLDAIVPGPDGGSTWARATLAGTSAGQAGRFRGAGGGDGGSVTMDAALIGTFH
ncbi:hypothetical protein EV385_5728 [Krasilnikovia cinnamomea]|uniref:Neocarzinostatin family protein n=1 Tax=Krasilnikovia cinnamomea TaxID=349313 RepID=A0A4Q7ZSG3_9ACTN|nr:hypothetical protein [Krasilnikovia cinnamomea]RZU53794.1 hypothetical protein EV385_5728 [Krasilnikovia cinnamomea]